MAELLSRDDLLSMRKTSARLIDDVRRLIACLGCARRGRRAGRHQQLRTRFRFRLSRAFTNDVDNVAIPVVIGIRSSLYMDAHVLYRGARDIRRSARKTVRRFCRPNSQSSVVDFGLFNAHSIGNKFSSVSQWITDNTLILAAVTESWHNEHDDPNLIACTPTDYCCVDRARPRPADRTNDLRTNHGGVCLFHHKSFRVRSVPLPSYDRFEYVSVFAQGHGMNLTVIVIYRPGSQVVSDAFFDEFADLLERVAVSPSTLLIVGDVNVHLDVATDSSTVKFNHLLAAHGLVQHVRSATHVDGHLLDVIITRDDSQISSVRVDPPTLSDHSLIVGQLASSAASGIGEALCIRRRCWRRFDIDEFTHDLQQSVSASLLSPPADADEWFRNYDRSMRSLLDRHAPLTSVRAVRHRSALWFDDDCRSAKARLRKLEKRYRRLHTPESMAEWRSQSKIVRSLYQSKFSSYWTDAFNECKGDRRALWSKADRLLCHSAPPSSSLTSDVFADHFRTKIDKIRQSTAGATRPVIVSRSTDDVFTSFDQVTVDEIMKLLGVLPSKQCSLDPIPTWLVKKSASHIAPLLCSMCNASLQSGRMPESQKHAVVYPRLKKASLDPDDPSSYRPISNLSFVSKLVERVVASRFVRHAECEKLFPANQSAYRQCHSTETAVCIVHNDIVRAVDRGHVTAVVLLDLSSAFDTVDHQVLLDVLEKRFVVGGVALSWFRSYLADRTQTFNFDKRESARYSVDCSVPQGSVLGPIEFIAYTEDAVEIFQRRKINHHMYADDVQLFAEVAPNDVGCLLVQLRDCLDEFIKWCASRRLQLNGTKTELIWFGSHSNITKLAGVDCSLSVGNVIIKPSVVVRNLGVLLDSELTLKQHVSKVASSCYYQIRRLRQVSRYVGRDIMKQLTSAFILSRLDYCNCILAGLPKSTISTLQHAQNAAARLVLGLRPRDHISNGLRELHWLPVESRIQYKLCLMMHMVHTGRCPSYISDILHPVAVHSGRPGLRSASTALFIKPKLRTVFGERAFSFAGPKAWNALPTHLHFLQSTITFKKHLKTVLFNAG